MYRNPAGSFLIALLIVVALGTTRPVVAAQAGTPDPALHYRVVAIAPDDVLNVREQPAPDAAMAGKLASSATGIVVTGLRSRIGSAMWWQIVHKDAPRGTGWVNARFLEAEPDAKLQSDFALLCRGNEPFWSLAMEEGEARFSTPEGTDKPWQASAWRNAKGLLPGHRFAIALQGAERSDAGWAAVARASHFCGDGMSDFEYPYDAIIMTPNGEVLAGCCTRSR